MKDSSIVKVKQASVESEIFQQTKTKTEGHCNLLDRPLQQPAFASITNAMA